MNRPIRVLHVIPSLARTGGVARFVYTMARNHDESRVHYDFLHHDTHNGKLLNELTYEPELEAMGAKVFYAEKAGLDFGRFVKDVDSFFDRHGCDYDVVHCHMPNAAFCVLRDAKRCGVPVRVLHSHLNNSSDVFWHRVRNAPLIALGKRYLTDRLACGEDAGKYLFGSMPFRIIRNGIDLEEYRYRKDVSLELRNILGIPDGAFVIGCVGRVCEQKNYTFAVNVLEKVLEDCPNARLVIVGDGPDKCALEEYITGRGLDGSVMLLGVRDDVNALYSVFDLLLMPSLYEGLPFTGIEAQAAGLPCVYSTGVPRQSDISGTGTFIPLSEGAASWAGTVVQKVSQSRLTGNTEVMEETGYSALRCAEELMAFYEEAIRRGRRQA